MDNLRVKFINNKWQCQVKRYGKWRPLIDKKKNIREFRKESDAWRIIEAYKTKGRGWAFGWKARVV